MANSTMGQKTTSVVNLRFVFRREGEQWLRGRGWVIGVVNIRDLLQGCEPGMRLSQSPCGVSAT